MKLLQIGKFDLADGFYPNVPNLCKCFQFHPNLYKTFIICPDIIEALGPSQFTQMFLILPET